MDIRPILSTLMRHKIASLLIVLEIALSCAIVCNALFLIGERMDRMNMPSGIAETELVRIQAASMRQLSGDNALNASITREYLDVLRKVPGVRHAGLANQIPFGGSSSNSGVRLDDEQQHNTLNATVYMDEGNLLETLGLRLLSGRDFTADEYQDMAVLETSGDQASVPGAIINRSMAEKLFPGQNPLGKTFSSWGESPTAVIGVIEDLARPNSVGDGPYAMIFALRDYGPGRHFILRTDPARRAEVLQAAVEAVGDPTPRLALVAELVDALP